MEAIAGRLPGAGGRPLHRRHENRVGVGYARLRGDRTLKKPVAEAAEWQRVADYPRQLQSVRGIAFPATAHPVPIPLDEAGIEGVIDAFEAGARRALKAGFKVRELHAAHGYLLHEFLSPISNPRNDQYGGTLENRMRLLLRIAERLRGLMPEELPLFVRISATDWVEGGWDIEQSVELAKQLKGVGVDLIDVSSGGTVPQARIPVARGYQVPFARRIREEVDIRTGAVGLITEPRYADEIITSGDANLVFIAREMLREPYWALKAQQALGEESAWPIQYGYVLKRRAK